MCSDKITLVQQRTIVEHSMRILHYNDEETELHRYLAERGHENLIVTAAEDPFAIVRRERVDAAFVGLHPHGLALMRQLHQRNPDCFVTLITSDRDTRRAVEAIKAGAFDYLISPLDFAEVERVCILMSRDERRRLERRRLREQLAAATGAPELIGDSEPMRVLRNLVARAAASSAPVLITGETGTGKELIARLLHANSPRRTQPFVSVNCNAIPATLLESELFGYRRGAFTGAVADRKGLIAQAAGGTFLFDEISDLDLPLQGKILRAVQEREIVPIGGDRVERVDVRFIAATNVDLEQMVRQGDFRQDLYYRLNVVPIRVPPLRQRMEDVALLVRHFVDLYSRREGREPLKVTPAVWRWLGAYHWPGNVRELENFCQRAVALAEGDSFDTDVLALTESFAPGSAGNAPAPGTPGDSTAPLDGLVAQLHSSDAGNDWRDSREQVERRIIETALREQHGNASRAARTLGISRTTLYTRMRRFGLHRRQGFVTAPAGNSLP